MAAAHASEAPIVPSNRRISPWVFVVLWAAALAAIVPFDERITDYFGSLAPENSVLRRIFKLATWSAPWWGFVLLGALLFNHRRWKTLVVPYATCVIGCIGALHLIKFIVGRARPDLNLGTLHFQMFGDPSAGFDSFPSGHSTQALLWAILVGTYFPRLRWVFYPLAVLTCLSRLVLDRHFPSDLVGAAGLVILAIWLARRWSPVDAFVPLRLADFFAKDELPAANSPADVPSGKSAVAESSST